MTRIFAGCALFVLALWQNCAAQGNAFVDSVHSASRFRSYSYNFHIPIGQTFIRKSRVGGVSILRSHMPDSRHMPKIDMDTSANRITTDLSLFCHTGSADATACSNRGENRYEYQVSNVNSMAEPDEFIWELNPDPGQPLNLDLQLGFGSARLDLSDLDVNSLKMFSGASDIYINYSEPNRARMKTMDIEGGMSKISIRNLELARARQVKIVNGMGNTKIVLGANQPEKAASVVEIGVGAGTCMLMIHDDHPVKLVLKDNLFSTVTLPDSYVEGEPQTFYNRAFAGNEAEATTIIVDLGVGSLEVINFNQ